MNILSNALVSAKSNLRSLLCLLIGLSVAFTAFDYKRVRQGEAPIFVIPTASFKDGGSVQLSGLAVLKNTMRSSEFALKRARRIGLKPLKAIV